ncbi:MAG: hypothetical protein Q9195_005808 [Heterodermia aff. obscurata]
MHACDTSASDCPEDRAKNLQHGCRFAEDEEDDDVCWSFQIMEGEDLMDRLWAYSLAFGKHGSGDDYYDEYVSAFQHKITGLMVQKCLPGNAGSEVAEAGELWFEPTENGLDEDEVDGNGIHGNRVNEDKKDK